MKNLCQRSRYATQESQFPKKGGLSLVKVKRRAGILNLFIKKKSAYKYILVFGY